MGSKRKIKLLLAGLLLMMTMAQSCQKHATPAPDPEIWVLFSPDGLGDLSYNDVVLRGIELFMNEEDAEFYISFMSPDDYEMARFLIQLWWDEREATDAEDGTVPRKMLMLADGRYADMAREIIDPALIGKDLSVLAFETGTPADASDALRSFELSLYGASWLAGRTARELGCGQPLVVLGDGSSEVIGGGRDGFTDGFNSQVPVHTLANDWQGYCMPMDAYQLMYGWDGTYDFVYSIAGGTNMGIYRYLRENPECGIYTAGMDTDQSPYSTLITGSMVKRIDLVVYDYLNHWFNRDDVPVHQVFGLESGFVDWVIPERYSHLKPAIEALRQEAIQKEKDYENGRH